MQVRNVRYGEGYAMGDWCGMVCGDAELLGANAIGGVLFWPSTLISVFN